MVIRMTSRTFGIQLTLVTWGNPHNDDILGVLVVLCGNQMENLVIDDASVRVIHGTVSADQELGNLGHFSPSVCGEEAAELGVGFEDVGDTLGGVESCDLDNILAAGPPELVHLLLDAHTPELAHVELGVPNAELLVQAIKPVGGSPEESQGLDGDIVRNEIAHRVTDEEIRVLDVIPKIFPDFLLRRTLLVDEVAADLNVGTVDDGEVWTGLLDQRDQTWHLGIIWDKTQTDSHADPERTHL